MSKKIKVKKKKKKLWVRPIGGGGGGGGGIFSMSQNIFFHRKTKYQFTLIMFICGHGKSVIFLITLPNISR